MLASVPHRAEQDRQRWASGRAAVLEKRYLKASAGLTGPKVEYTEIYGIDLRTLSSKGLLGIAFSAYPGKRQDCEKPEEQPPHNIDGVMKHAVDSGNGKE